MRKRTLLEKRNNQGYLYILPWIIGFLVFQLYPLVMSLFYSFTNFKMSANYKMVGFANYIRIFTRDIEVQNSLWTTFTIRHIIIPAG